MQFILSSRSKGFDIRNFRSSVLIVIVVIFCNGCIGTLQQQVESLIIELAANQEDTVSIFPTLFFSFSSAVAEGTPLIEFQPPFFDFYCFFNKSRDTLTLVVSGQLEPSMRYSLRFSGVLKSADGKQYSLEKDSFIIITTNKEQEPNNSFLTADILKDRICGVISSISDTDYFYIPHTESKRIFLRSLDSRVGLSFLKDNNIISPSEFLTTESVIIPDSLEPPFFVITYAAIRNSYSRYELSFVPTR